MAAPSSVTPVLIEQKIALIDHDSNSRHFRNMSHFTMDEKRLKSDDDLEEYEESEESEESEYKQNADTMHSILLTPTSTMKYLEFEKNNKNYMQMSLLKYPGDYHHNIRYFAAPHSKYILYLPSLRMFFYGSGNNNIENNTLINVQQICISDDKVTNKCINKQYKDQWIKIIGKQRIALFVSKTQNDIILLAKYIQNSLNNDLYQNKMYNKQKDYIQGILYKFIGKNMTEAKFNKVHQKNVIFIPSSKMLIYGDNNKDRQKCNILQVIDINRNYYDVHNKSMDSKYRNTWFKVIATTRDVIFAGLSAVETENWYKTIKTSL